MKITFFSKEVRKNDKKCYRLSDSCSESRTLNSHIASEDEEYVEYHIKHTADDGGDSGDDCLSVISCKGGKTRAHSKRRHGKHHISHIINAERKSSSEKTDENNYVRRERTYGSFRRAFDLDGIKSDGIAAAYKDGILELTLPKEDKKVEDAGRRLEIK